MGGILAYFLASYDASLDEPDQVTGLTKREVKVIQDTWIIMKQDMATTGKELFILLFKDQPDYQRFFKSFAHVPIEKLSGSDKFQAHALTVMYSLTSFIDNLDSPEVLRELVYRTARNHNSRGVSSLQFENFTRLMIGALETKNKRRLNEDTVKAWTKLISLLNKVFDEGVVFAKQNKE